MKNNRVELELIYQYDVSEWDNYTYVHFVDDDGNKYVWKVYCTPNMSKIPSFFSKCTCIKGDIVNCKANIIGVNKEGVIWLKNLRIINK